MTRNLFTPPTSHVADPVMDPLPGRPALVTVIVIYYGFAVLLSITVRLFILGRPDMVPATVRTPFLALSAWNMGFWFAMVGIKVWAVVALFRLKSYAIALLIVPCFVGLLSNVTSLFSRHWHGSTGSPQDVGAAVGALLGSVLSIAIIVYAVRLRQRGILRP